VEFTPNNVTVGRCINTFKDCCDSLDCTIDSCDPTNGTCVHDYKFCPASYASERLVTTHFLKRFSSSPASEDDDGNDDDDGDDDMESLPTRPVETGSPVTASVTSVGVVAMMGVTAFAAVAWTCRRK